MEWGEETRHECKKYEDDGYSACDSWADEGYYDCCDWAPCSWVCDALVWISNWVCKAWYWISNFVCVIWTYVVETVCVVFKYAVNIVCSLVGGFLKTVAMLLGEVVCGIEWVVSLVSGSGSQPSIRHVFVLMLENRSFDHMLGFSGIEGRDAVTGGPARVDGLIGNPQSNIDPEDGKIVFASTPADFAIPPEDGDPSHEFQDVLRQLCGTGAKYPDPGTGAYPPIFNSGFIANYRYWVKSAHPRNIMNCLAPEQLPVLNALARNFAVCDRWFSSLPGPTWPNRFFVHAASSGGLDDSPSSWETLTSTGWDGYRFENGTIYDRLEEKCLDWEVFEGDETPQVFAISGMNLYAMEGKFTDFDEFAEKLNDPGYSPHYVFIEPSYGNVLPKLTPADMTCGTSQHPIDDVTRGEGSIKKVYDTIRNSPHWLDSLLIIMYDEHGGFFDHVVPPKAIPPGDATSDADNNKNGFDFQQLGVRVPVVIVSPYIPAGTVDHTVYDHTSVLASVERLFGLKPLTNRDANANDFLHLLSLETPRSDVPSYLPDPAISGFRCEDDPAASVPTEPPIVVDPGHKWHAHHRGKKKAADVVRKRHEPGQGRTPSFVWGFAHVAFLKHLSHASPNARVRRAIAEQFLNISTADEARAYIQEVRTLLRASKKGLPSRRIQTLRPVPRTATQKE